MSRTREAEYSICWQYMHCTVLYCTVGAASDIRNTHLGVYRKLNSPVASVMEKLYV